MPRTPLALDTSPDAERLQIEGWRHMSSEQKAATVTALTTMAIELAEAGIRHRHPDESDRVRRRRLAVLLLGPELAALVVPDSRGAP